MPSLMPGMPGTKEAYGLSLINSDFTVKIPPDALKRYTIANGDVMLLMTTHVGEGGFVLVKRDSAEASVFGKLLNQIGSFNTPVRIDKKAYVITEYADNRLTLSEDILGAFHLSVGQMLMSVKSTTITLSFTPKEIWMEKFSVRGLTAAADNIEKLPVF